MTLNFKVRVTLVLALVVSFVLLGCKSGNLVSTGDVTTEPAKSPGSVTDAVVDDNKLERIDELWSLYTGTDPDAIAHKRYMIQHQKFAMVDRALQAYWDYSDHPPVADTAMEALKILEEDGLVPFILLDPADVSKITFSDSIEAVESWADVHIKLGSNGFFDYRLMGVNPIDNSMYPSETNYRSEQFSNLAHEYYAEQPGFTEPLPKPVLPSDSFILLVRGLYTDLIMHSFLTSGGICPSTFDELLGDNFAVNEAGWGHPAGMSFNDGEIGDFEFGVIPATNVYYFKFTSATGYHEIYYSFMKSLVQGEMVYDITDSLKFISSAHGEDLYGDEMPLLTDELFNGPPPTD